MSEKKVIANSTNQNVRSIMEELHISLTPNKEHKTVIPNVHVVGLRNEKNLNDYLVRTKLPNLEESG